MDIKKERIDMLDITKKQTLKHNIDSHMLDAYWMPFSGNRQFKKNPRIITHAKGHYYIDDKGRKIFDGLSGLWTCGLGHGNEKINDAITKQLQELDYAPPFQFAHPKSFELANRITDFMPKGLNRVFFTGSGSESVDSALKIARAYWAKKGMPQKKRFIGRIKGYHGVNFGGTSVGGIAPNRHLFSPEIDAIHLPHTQIDDNRFSQGQPQYGKELANHLEEQVLFHGADTIAAVIVEPLSGSAGVIPPPIGYLDTLKAICQKHNILLIFDEVITAFGRMGGKTGAEVFNVTPDIITTAKQLTNGVIPMGAVIVKEEIYNTFMNANLPEYMLEFPHGYTYSAHPVACAAALATLDILEKENIFETVKTISPYFEQKLHSLKGIKYITDIRNYGLAGALTLETAPNEPALRPFMVAMECWQKGFYVRYGNDTLQLGLPFKVSKEEIDRLIDTLQAAINHLS